MIPAIVIVLSQAAQAGQAAKSGDWWCFDRGQNAQLCEDTEDACNKLREINTEIAQSPMPTSISSGSRAPADRAATTTQPGKANADATVNRAVMRRRGFALIDAVPARCRKSAKICWLTNTLWGLLGDFKANS
jgi:hypothetical protein